MDPSRHAQVCFKDKSAGVLRQHAGGDSTFTYNDGWEVAIGCALPLTPNVHTWKAGLHPFFQHIAAEGWLRERQARVSVLDQDDDLGLLLRYGHDCIGAVSVHDAADGKQTPIVGDIEPAARAALKAERTISGVQKKLLVIKGIDTFEPADRDGPAPYIAKFNSEEIDSLVQNEAHTLTYARDLLGADAVTAASVGNVTNLGPALIVKRFDRTTDNQKLRLEDLAQVLAIPRRPDNSGKYSASYEECADAVRKYSVRPEIDLLRFFRLVVANAVLGNCDAHVKNFSLLETPEGLRLAPAYDLVNTAVYWDRNYSTEFALTLNGYRQKLDRLDNKAFQQFGRAIGLNDRTVTATLQDLARRAEKVLADCRKKLDRSPESKFLNQYHDIVASAVPRIFP